MFVWKKTKPIVLEVIMEEEFQAVQPLVVSNRDKKACMKPDPKFPKGEFATCWANVETQKNSLTLKSWYEFWVELTPERISFYPPAGTQATIQGHTDQASDFCAKGNFEIVKLETPMHVRCKEYSKFIMAPSPFTMIDLYMPSGPIVFDLQFASNVFFYYPRDTHRKFKINFNQPLAQFYPLEDHRRLKVKYIYDDVLFEKMTKARMPFMNKHWMRKQRTLGLKPYWPEAKKPYKVIK